MTDHALDDWWRLQLGLRLLAVDPVGLGGLHLRARSGPLRDRFIQDLSLILPSARRFSPSISDIQLFGGVDISATLSAGSVRLSTGLLERGLPLCLTMAERTEQGLAARLGQFLDQGSHHGLLLLDEGIEDEEIPSSLAERMAFSVALGGFSAGTLELNLPDPDDALDLSDVEISDGAIPALTVAAARLGIDSLRAPLFAIAAARAHAALHQRTYITDDDLHAASALVLAHRATILPQDEDDQHDASDSPQNEPGDGTDSKDEADVFPEDLLIEAVKAALPQGILTALSGGKSTKTAKGAGGAGGKRKGNRRGRPLPSRPGHPDGQRRIDIIATLRAAAPWQRVRRMQTPDRKGILIRASDIHIRRFQEMSDRLIIFAVDASGSSAVARLAEAKGAVELMLAEAYARRDHVALVAFRGETAEILLQPTRSLVQTKRHLAGLPGGGGTPLAAGLKCTAELASRCRSQGLSPSLALLTDGRANVPLPGRVGRQAANEDAKSMARVVRELNLPSAVIDTANRPQKDLFALSEDLAATYIALPRADARSLSNAVGTALGE